MRVVHSTALLHLRQQAVLNNARIAIAVERFRAKNGSLPAKLTELAPRYLRKIPIDPISGKLPRYKTTPNAGVIIYSIGADEDDDGGRPVSPEEEIGDADGDWVWRTVAPQN